MAISLISQPTQIFMPAYNPIQWVFSSTNTAICDMAYICDVYINGSFAVRLQAEPEGASNYGTFRIERVLQDYIDKNFKHDLVGFGTNPDEYVYYTLELRERYNANTNCIGPVTLTSVLYTTSTSPVSYYYAWNGALQYKEFTTYSTQNYVADSALTKFLTKTPQFLNVPFYTCPQPTNSYTIDGAYTSVSGNPWFILDGGSGGIVLPIGTQISYSIDSGSASILGIPTIGTTTVIGYDAIGFSHILALQGTPDPLPVGLSSSGLITVQIEAIESNGWMCLSFLQDYTNIQVDSMEVKTYDISNGLINTYNIPNAFADNHQSVGVGPNNLNAWASSQSPVQPDIIDNNVKYYSVQLLDFTAAAVSEVKYFMLDKRQTKFKSYRIHWLNRLGGYDSYTFDLLATRKIDVTRNTYTRMLDYNYDEGDRGETGINVAAKETYKFATNWMRKQDSLWMEDLYTSTDVYVTDNTTVEKLYEITSYVYDLVTGNIDLVMPAIPAVGTTFSYIITVTNFVDQQFTGTGTILSISGAGNAKTNITFPGAGGFGNTLVGVLTANIPTLTIIPMIPIQGTWEDKASVTGKNISYSIEMRTSYDVNVQSF
jgi:hypothetical protein